MIVRRPIYLPPVWCVDNSDGTYSWPFNLNGHRCWSVIKKPLDIPPAYLNPPSEKVWIDQKPDLAKVG